MLEDRLVPSGSGFSLVVQDIDGSGAVVSRQTATAPAGANSLSFNGAVGAFSVVAVSSFQNATASGAQLATTTFTVTLNAPSADTLRVFVSATDYGLPSGNPLTLTSHLGGSGYAGTSMALQSFADAANNLFGVTAPALDPTVETVSPGAVSTTLQAAAGGNFPADLSTPFNRNATGYSLTNVTTVAGLTPSLSVSADVNTEVVPAPGAPNVTVTKTADASPVNAGTTAGFTVTISNIGTGTATGVALTDPLPGGLGHDITWAIDAGSPNAGAFAVSGATGSQTLALSPSGISLAAGASLTVHVTGATTFADVSATTFTGTLPNTATVTAANEAPALQNQQASATITVVAPDVTVTKTADASPINAGTVAGFTVTIKNIGAGTATGVTLTDPLPSGLGHDITWVIDAGSPNAGAFAVTGAAGSQSLALSPSGVTLAAGASLTVHVTGATTFADVSATTFSGTLPNTATVSATNEAPGLQNQQASATVTVIAPDVDVLKTADQATVGAGATAGFTVKIFNEGAATATGVSLNDPLPAGAGHDINWHIDSGTGNPSAFTVTGAVGSQVLGLSPSGISLAAGASLTVHVTGVPSAADAPGPYFHGTLPNTATVNAGNEAVGEQNAQSSATITVTAPPPVPLARGETATIGFWHNKNGQALINSLNGGPGATALATWLATTFPNLYGPTAGANNLTGKTNAQVAAYFLSLFGVSGQKTGAQVLGAALAVYVTNSTLAGGTMATGYGFLVNNSNGPGTGNASFNVGANGAAFGVPNNTTLTVLQLLLDLNAYSGNGNIESGNGTLQNEVNTVFDGVNQGGDIGLVAAGSTSSSDSATAALATVLQPLKAWSMTVAVDTGTFTDGQAAAELARVADAIAALNVMLGSEGVNLVAIQGDDSVPADVHVHLAATSVIGGVAQGVLGVTQAGGEITLITGWNYYLGTDPTAVGAGQYDFRTVATHELGHALGLGHSTDTGSVMFPYLGTGQARYTLTAVDLALIHGADTGPEPLLAASAARGHDPGCSCPACRAAWLALQRPSEPCRLPAETVSPADPATVAAVVGGTAGRLAASLTAAAPSAMPLAVVGPESLGGFQPAPVAGTTPCARISDLDAGLGGARHGVRRLIVPRSPARDLRTDVPNEPGDRAAVVLDAFFREWTS